MEYGLSHSADYAGRGARAGAYRRFVFEEVLPAVRERCGDTLNDKAWDESTLSQGPSP